MVFYAETCRSFLMQIYIVFKTIQLCISLWKKKLYYLDARYVEHVWNVMAHAQKPDLVFLAKRTSPFKLAWGGGFSSVQSTTGSRGVHTSAVVMVVMLDAPCSEVESKTPGYPLHSYAPPSLPLPCVTVCHHISTELYSTWKKKGEILIKLRHLYY